MRKIALILLGLYIVTTAQTDWALAQDNPPPYEHLKHLEGFIGDWEGEFDPPGEIPKGPIRVSVKWMNHKTHVMVDVQFSPGGGESTLHPMFVIIGYNGKTQAPHSWHHGLMAYLDRPVTLSENKLVMEGEGTRFDGSAWSGKTTYELRSPDVFVSRMTEIVRNGKPQPDEDSIVLRRAKK